MRLLRIFIAVFIVQSVFFSQLLADREADSLQLVKIYNNTDGANWTKSWNLNESMDTWWGVLLTNNGTVRQLKLSVNKLSGDLPNFVLPDLEQLVLNNNDLRNVLHDFDFPKLILLSLENNELRGEIPNFNNLPKLQTLRLNANNFTGQIPDFTNLPDLQSLILFDNELEGQIPPFGLCQKLSSINISQNLLIGGVPSFVQKDLVSIDLSENDLSGFIPEFRNLSSLFVLNLSSNRLTGPIPNFNNPLLLDLNLSNNQLAGDVPGLTLLTELETLNLSNNLLDGSTYNFFTNDKLLEIDLSGNELGGQLPNFDISTLRILDVSGNKFIDTVPDLLGCENLEELYLNNNLFTGSYFDAALSLNLDILYTQRNKFTFDDLLALNTGAVTEFKYSPQANVPMPDTIFAIIREDVEIDLMIDEEEDNNTYTWFKDDQVFKATDVNKLLLINVNLLDEAEYTCYVRNNLLPQLTILCDTSLLLVTCPLDSLNLEMEICAGDTFQLNGVNYTETGVYLDTIFNPDAGTCDTLVTLNISVFPLFDTLLADTICEGESYVFGDTTLTKPGSYIDSLQAGPGCDSIVRLQLVVLESYTRVKEEVICEGDTLFVGELARTTTGIYFDTLTTMGGCDSVIISDLTVLEGFQEDTTVVLCMGDSYEWRGMTFTESGTYFDSYTNMIGCDSSYILHLEILSQLRTNSVRRICTGDSVVIGSNIYKERGIYTDTLTSTLGCDSIVITMLTVHDGFEDTYDFEICEGDTLEFGGQIYTEAGIYLDTMIAKGGCDSIVKIRLNLTNEIIVVVSQDICPGDSVFIGGSYYKGNVDVRDTVTSEFCDTIYEISITEYTPIEVFLEQTTFRAEDSTGTIRISAEGGSGMYTYNWIDGTQDSIIADIEPGTYEVIVSDGICAVVDSFTFDIATGAKDYILDDQFLLYPNPVQTNQTLTLRLVDGEPDEYVIQVFNLFGQEIKRLQTKQLENFTFAGPATPGTYFFRISNKKGESITKKLLVR